MAPCAGKEEGEQAEIYSSAASNHLDYWSKVAPRDQVYLDALIISYQYLRISLSARRDLQSYDGARRNVGAIVP